MTNKTPLKFIIVFLLFVMPNIVWGHNNTDSVRDTTGLIILTVPNYLSVIDRFADWKRTMGINVNVVSAPRGIPLQIITEHLKTITDNNPSYRYLLIIGDQNDIPTNTNTIYLKGTQFDDDGRYSDGNYTHSSDRIYGFASDSIATPRLRVGRIPVSTIDEAEIVIEKIINYEKSPSLDSEYYSRGLNISCFQDRNQGADAYEDYRFIQTTEETTNFLEDKGMNVGRLYDIFSDAHYTDYYWNNNLYSNGMQIPTDVRALLEYHYGNSMVADSINLGLQYVFYYDHGNIDGWMTTDFRNENIRTLNNGKKMPVVFSFCCHTGNFTSTSDCFAETFLKKSGGGCVGIIAATNVMTTGFSDSMIEAMFSNIWADHEPGLFISSLGQTNLNPLDYSEATPVYRLGDILVNSLDSMKVQFLNCDVYNLNHTIAPHEDINSFIKYYYDIFHLFGDPTMEMRTAMPVAVAAPSIYINNNNICVCTSDGPAKISFYRTGTSQVESYLGTEAAIPLENENFTICVYRHNSIPFIMEFGSDIFIQREEIEGNRHYKGNNIFVGNSVTEQISNGNVTIASGSNVKIHGTKVVLSAGTGVEKGAKLNIKTE